MNRSEIESFSEGGLAFRRGEKWESCKRRGTTQKKAWQSGFEEQRRLKIQEKATPEQLANARAALRKIREHLQKS